MVLMASISNLVFKFYGTRLSFSTEHSDCCSYDQSSCVLVAIVNKSGSNYRFILGTGDMTVTNRCNIICK